MLFESPQLQPRDVELFADLLDCRFMALRHIAAIHFDGRIEAAKKRVQRLKKAKYLTVLPRTVSEPALYTLSSKSFDILRTEGKLDPLSMPGWRSASKRLKVSRLTLEHELMVMDCKAAFVSALKRRPGDTLLEFSTWPDRLRFQVVDSVSLMKVTVKPDGLLRIMARSGESRCYLEVDRSTEVLQTLINRLAYYRAFNKGAFISPRGASRQHSKPMPFRVLVVTPSLERSNNLAERLLTLHPPIRSLVWLSTMPEVLSNTLGAIWFTPKDYAQAAAKEGLPRHAGIRGDDPSRRRRIYEIIAIPVTKHPLLD